jgi:P27 family predicted phage terminase small subunit
MRKPTRKIWDYFLESVVPDGVVTQSDAVLFAELCELYEEIGNLRRKLRTRGRSLTTAAGGEKGSPLANQLDKTLSKFYSLSSRFGMDPSSRASLNIKDEDLRHKSGRGKKLDDLIRGSSN